jgi:hypothetical protein
MTYTYTQKFNKEKAAIMKTLKYLIYRKCLEDKNNANVSSQFAH